MRWSRIACVTKRLCATSDGQLAIALGRPIKARALVGYKGDKERICLYNGKIYRRLVTSLLDCDRFEWALGSVINTSPSSRNGFRIS